MSDTNEKDKQTAIDLSIKSSGLLCRKTIEVCAKLLDDDADRQEKVWNKYLASGHGGPATSLYTIPREYARRLRDLET